MADLATSRRSLLGAITAAPALATCALPTASPAAIFAGDDPVWPKLVADFRAKHAAWEATIDPQEEAGHAFQDACASGLPEPLEPGSASRGNVLDMTLRELRDAGDAPERKAAWAQYEQDHAAWKSQRDALHDQIVGPASAAYDRASAIQSDAFDALITHRVTNLRDLGEKIEIATKHYVGCDIPLKYVAEILADVRHLDGSAGA